MHSSKLASRLCDALILSPLLAVSHHHHELLVRFYGSLLKCSIHPTNDFEAFSNQQYSPFFSRFSQQFIDIRENERKRSQRGLVSIPSKYSKLDDDKSTQNETASNANGTTATATTTITQRPEINTPGFKPEHLLELQEKITKEILSTKLGENEMHELQVNIMQLFVSILPINCLPDYILMNTIQASLFTS